MAVIERKTKTGTTYRIAFRDADGKQIWEPAGSDCRVAQALERQRKREVRAGTFATPSSLESSPGGAVRALSS
jgi:hypothetical protein